MTSQRPQKLPGDADKSAPQQKPDVEDQSSSPQNGSSLLKNQVLNLQRTLGNQATQRMLTQNRLPLLRSPLRAKPSLSQADNETQRGEQAEEAFAEQDGVMAVPLADTDISPGSETTVQRNNNRAEFVPQIEAGPQLAFMFVFSRHTQTWKIKNRRDAPSDTFFHWGYGTEDETLRILKHRTSDHGATERIEFEAQKPGTTRIQGTPVHQVPGGPEITGETQYVDVVVEPPTVEHLSTSYRREDGSPSAEGRLSVGDKMIVRVKVGNVDGAHMQTPNTVSYSGQGYELMSKGPLQPVQKFVDGASYDIEMTALRPGSVNMDIELGIGNSVIGIGPKVSGVQTEIEFSRQEFLNKATQCLTKIEIAYSKANSVMEVLSAAYGNAYDNHTKTLQAQDASNRLAEDILLGAALAFIPGGVGGVVGGMMKNAKAGDFLADAVKDLAKAGTRGLQGAALQLAGGGGGGSPMRPMATDPRTWRAQFAVYVNEEKGKVLKDLDSWQTKANNADPDFYLNFDPVATMDAALILSGQMMKDIEVPDQAEHERQFELGFWREWLQQYGWTVTEMYTRGGPTSLPTENQGKKIRDRINQLRENGDQWLEQYGGIARKNAEAEAERRNKERRKSEWGF